MQVLVPESDPPRMEIKLTPCSPGDVGAVERTWSDVTSDELLEPPLYVVSATVSLFNVLIFLRTPLSPAAGRIRISSEQCKVLDRQ